MEYKNMYDMIIVGGGPAGIASAIYMARAKYKVLVIEKEKIGGQILITSEIVNYPGVYKTSGKDLMKEMQKQAISFGVDFKIAKVENIKTDEDIKIVETNNGEYKAISVVLALGAHPRKVGFTGEDEFLGRGIAYCATCDGEFFTNKPIYVVGGGFAAVEESIFLTRYGTEVNLLVRGDKFNCAQTISDKLLNEPKIKIHFNTEILSVGGKSSIEYIKIKNNITNEIIEKNHINGLGVFVFAGYQPNTEFLNNLVSLENGYIVLDEKMQTNIEGIYGAGDVCKKDLRQVVTAVSDGALAATSAEKYVESIHKKHNIPNFIIEKKELNTDKPSDIKNESYFENDIKQQLDMVFNKFENHVKLKVSSNETEESKEMIKLVEELCILSDKLSIQIEENSNDKCFIEIIKSNEEKGIKYYAMPGGHEFNSFVLTLYNYSGKGQEINEELLNKVIKIKKAKDIKVLMTMTCTMCPDVVVATGKIASLNKNVNASVIDISKHSEIKEKYNVMSVPCIVVDEEKVNFGKKSLEEIINLLI